MANTSTFIGVDLAWRSDRNRTGAAVLQGDRQGAQLLAVSEPICTLEGVRRFITNHTTSRTFTAIDAPLIITNATGQRPCETAVGERYGAREASCHTSNLRLYPDATSVALAKGLVVQGYVHAPEATETSNRVVLEVYPHAALVALFDLLKSLKYKKGRLEQKRRGLQILSGHIPRLFSGTPRLRPNDRLGQLLSRDISMLPGPDLKVHEDTLDAVLCAYLAYYFWYWRVDRNEVFGDVGTGYIVNPTLLIGGIESYGA